MTGAVSLVKPLLKRQWESRRVFADYPDPCVHPSQHRFASGGVDKSTPSKVSLCNGALGLFWPKYLEDGGKDSAERHTDYRISRVRGQFSRDPRRLA